MTTYAIRASYEGHDSTSPETMGTYYGLTYSTQEEAEKDAAELTGTAAYYDIDGVTYHVVLA